MEWVIDDGDEKVRVHVPDEYLERLIFALRTTGVPLDPYEDRHLLPDTVETLLPALELALLERDAQIQRSVSEALGSATIKSWVRPVLAQRLSSDPYRNVLIGLVTLCREALSNDTGILLLGA